MPQQSESRLLNDAMFFVVVVFSVEETKQNAPKHQNGRKQSYSIQQIPGLRKLLVAY